MLVLPVSSRAFSASAMKDEFLIALRACWAALWTTNARRAMTQRDLYPSDTAMAVLIQPLVAATASGGGLSETAEGNMLLSATWGLGSAIAQGEVVPDRIVFSRQGFLRTMESGRKHHRDACLHGLPAAAAEGAGGACDRAMSRRRPGDHAWAAHAQGRRIY